MARTIAVGITSAVCCLRETSARRRSLTRVRTTATASAKARALAFIAFGVHAYATLVPVTGIFFFPLCSVIRLLLVRLLELWGSATQYRTPTNPQTRRNDGFFQNDAGPWRCAARSTACASGPAQQPSGAHRRVRLARRSTLGRARATHARRPRQRVLQLCLHRCVRCERRECAVSALGERMWTRARILAPPKICWIHSLLSHIAKCITEKRVLRCDARQRL